MNEIEKDLTENLEVRLENNLSRFNQNGNENKAVIKNLVGIIKLVRDSLQHKKMNLLGCKMKIYQERLRQIQFLEVLNKYKECKKYEDIQHINHYELDGLLDITNKIPLKI